MSDDSATSGRTRPSPDARLIADAIRHSWIARGFYLGIGFWLAGLAIVGVTLLAVWFLLIVNSPDLIPGGGNASAEPSPDPRSWQEQLNAQDAAARAMKSTAKR